MLRRKNRQTKSRNYSSKRAVHNDACAKIVPTTPTRLTTKEIKQIGFPDGVDLRFAHCIQYQSFQSMLF